MRMRSTGLGKTELQAHIANLEPAGDMLILHIQSTSPVRWHIRAGIQPEDRLALLKFMLKLNVRLLKYLNFLNPRGKHPEPEEF